MPEPSISLMRAQEVSRQSRLVLRSIASLVVSFAFIAGVTAEVFGFSSVEVICGPTGETCSVTWWDVGSYDLVEMLRYFLLFAVLLQANALLILYERGILFTAAGMMRLRRTLGPALMLALLQPFNVLVTVNPSDPGGSSSYAVSCGTTLSLDSLVLLCVGFGAWIAWHIMQIARRNARELEMTI